jgi:hypothetical protein
MAGEANKLDKCKGLIRLVAEILLRSRTLSMTCPIGKATTLPDTTLIEILIDIMKPVFSFTLHACTVCEYILKQKYLHLL